MALGSPPARLRLGLRQRRREQKCPWASPGPCARSLPADRTAGRPPVSAQTGHVFGSGLASGWVPTSGRQEKWLFRARAFVEAWHLHVRCLAPVARVQKRPAILLRPHDNAAERTHGGECLADRGRSWTRRSPVGTVRPGRRAPGTVPVIPGRGRSVREPQREGPDSCRCGCTVTHS